MAEQPVDAAANPADLEALVEGVIRGERRSIARCLRTVDDHPIAGRKISARLHPHLSGARVIGITGNPGAGKSTVVDQIIAMLRGRNQTVAVLAIDPSSPFSGGAILGDRIRMSRHFNDDGVFIRSLATRGALGGLSRSTFDSVRVLDAAGFDVVLVETVGVGQDEIDVMRLVETTVVVLVPGLGDDIQAIKAGLLEIADVFLINKADRDGVPELERGLQQLLALAASHDCWQPPIEKTVATRGEGFDNLMQAMQQHAEHLIGPDGQERQRGRQRQLFARLLDASLVEMGRAKLGVQLAIAEQKVVEQDADPYATVEALLEQQP